MMLSESLTHECTARLNAAQNRHLIDGWKPLGPYFIVCRGHANFYVEADAVERLLKSFCAVC